MSAAHPYLVALGFFDDWDATAEAARRAGMEVLPTGATADPATLGRLQRRRTRPWHQQFRVATYGDPSGARICFIESAGAPPEAALTVSGGAHAHATVEAFQIMPGLAAVDIFDGGQLFTRILASVDDPHMYPWFSLNSVGAPARHEDFRLGAIANEVSVYDSVDAWAAARGRPDSGARIGPRFVASNWLFALAAGDATAEEANPIAVFKAICGRVEALTNRLTGRQWYRVDADCGFPCTLALPIDVKTAPREGSVVDGNAYLTGTTGFWD
ncbi:MAG: hypothetical protein Q3979_03680 [Actinomycetaceae bacterium]|nr:hypothetical protein [Actinomycetaceae bacterium]